MSDNVLGFTGLNEVERDLVELGLADPESLRNARTVRERAEEVL